MAVKPNETTEGTGSSKLYTGVAQLKVVAINPTQEQLKALGYKADKEPVYRDAATGNQRVTFFLEGKVGTDIVKTNRAFFLKDKKAELVFINKEGRYGKDRSKLTGEIRNPFEGEVDLIMFLGDWCNIKKGEECFLESIEKIVRTGDLFELRDILKNAGENTFKGLLGVRDGKYQAVYTKKQMRSWSTDLSYLHKSLVDNEQYTKEDFGPIDLKLFVPEQFDLRAWKGQTASLAGAVETHTNGAATAAGNAALPTAEAGLEVPPDDAPPF